MPICLVTGANGFVGQALCRHLLTQQMEVRGTLRAPLQQPLPFVSPGFSAYITGAIDASTDWLPVLRQVDYVVHLAATVHRPDIHDPAVYSRSIREATCQLAQQAITAGVKRFIYVSSAHVYGVAASSAPITESHSCHPLTPYAQAKCQAETWLMQHMHQVAMEIVVVRPPLVYGPGVGGNFAQLIKLVRLLPYLPLGCATQLRSLVGLDNLVDFLWRCLEHPQAANSVFNIADGQDVSTRVLCEKLAQQMAKSRVLVPIPARLLQLGLQLSGHQALYTKLFTAMQLDIGYAQQRLSWQPPVSLDEQLARIFQPAK